MTDKLHDITYI